MFNEIQDLVNKIDDELDKDNSAPLESLLFLLSDSDFTLKAKGILHNEIKIQSSTVDSLRKAGKEDSPEEREQSEILFRLHNALEVVYKLEDY